MIAPTDALALAERLRGIARHYRGLVGFGGMVKTLSRSATALRSLTSDVERVTRERDEARRKLDTAAERYDGLDEASDTSNAALRERVKALEGALSLADNALHEATAILGGEYGDHYGPLCEKMIALEEKIAALSPDAQVPVAPTAGVPS